MLQRQTKGKGRAAEEDEGGNSVHHDPLSVLDEDASAEPLDNQEQEAILKAFQESNEKSNYIYRWALVLSLGLILFLYLTPIPDYVMGTHDHTHHTLFFAAVHIEGTHDDLVRLPALPIYLVFFLIQGTLVFAALVETADRLGLVRSKGKAFPYQPHLFGTAPDWLAPILTDLRWHPALAAGGTGRIGQRADGGGENKNSTTTEPNFIQTMPPRLLYLSCLLFVSLPVPLLTFGGGSFSSAGWWAITTAGLGVVVGAEAMMASVEKNAQGLSGMRYNYKGA